MVSDIKESTMSIRTWVALFILALSTFTIVTTELAPVGLLTPIANGLHASESEIGMTVSLYAWIGALSALFASVFLGNFPKKDPPPVTHRRPVHFERMVCNSGLL